MPFSYPFAPKRKTASSGGKKVEYEQYKVTIRKEYYHDDVSDVIDDHEKRILYLEKIVGGLGPTIGPIYRKKLDPAAEAPKGQKKSVKGSGAQKKGTKASVTNK